MKVFNCIYLNKAGKVKDVLKIRLLTNETRGIVFAGQGSKIQKWKVNARNLPFKVIRIANFVIIHQYFFLEELDF